MYAIPGEGLTANLVNDPYAVFLCQLLEAGESLGRRFATDPQSADSEIAQNRCQASKVILMRMREGHNIQRFETAPPEVRRNRLFAGINPVVLFLPRKAAKCATAVNQQSLSVGRDQQQGISLPHVQYPQLKLPLHIVRREGEQS